MQNQDQHGHILDNAMQMMTTYTATGTTVVTGILVWVFDHQTQITFTLMSIVFMCQICAFGYRFYRFLRNKK